MPIAAAEYFADHAMTARPVVFAAFGAGFHWGAVLLESRAAWRSLSGCHAGIRTGILQKTPARMPTWQPERLRYGCTLKRQPRAKLEGAWAAGAEDVAETAGGLAEARGQQVVFVGAAMGGVCPLLARGGFGCLVPLVPRGPSSGGGVEGGGAGRGGKKPPPRGSKKNP